MAKITITITDEPGGKVSVVSDPNMEQMCKMEVNGHVLTAAHAYAVCGLNAIRKAAKSQESKLLVDLPLVDRPYGIDS